jgi:hypothetical protein
MRPLPEIRAQKKHRSAIHNTANLAEFLGPWWCRTTVKSCYTLDANIRLFGRFRNATENCAIFALFRRRRQFRQVDGIGRRRRFSVSLAELLAAGKTVPSWQSFPRQLYCLNLRQLAKVPSWHFALDGSIRAKLAQLRTKPQLGCWDAAHAAIHPT